MSEEIQEPIKMVMSEKGKKQFKYVYNKFASEKIEELSEDMIIQLEANKTYGTNHYVIAASLCRMGQERVIAFENDWFYSEGPKVEEVEETS